MVSSLVRSTRAINGVPIFPARIVEKPASFKICSTKEVVVVLPFEPVMPIRRPCRKRSASSTSLHMERSRAGGPFSARTPDWHHRLKRQDHDDFLGRTYFEGRRFFHDSCRKYRHSIDCARGADQRRHHHCGGVKQFSTGAD